MAHLVEVDDAFRGPLDLLLHLVRREEIDLHDIPVARLTRAYLDEIARMDFIDVDQAAEFLSLASILVELKSKTLLPPIETEDDPEADAEELDPRAGLVKALLEYKRYREAATMLETLAARHADRFGRGPAPLPEDPEAAEDEEVGRYDIGGLLTAFQKMLDKMQVAAASEIVNPHVPTERRMEQIAVALTERGVVRFSELLSASPSRDEMVGFFIAVLELIRQHKLRARQSLDFSDIVLVRRDDQPSGESDARARRRRRRRVRIPADFLATVPRRIVALGRPGLCVSSRWFPVFPDPVPSRPTGGKAGGSCAEGLAFRLALTPDSSAEDGGNRVPTFFAAAVPPPCRTPASRFPRLQRYDARCPGEAVRPSPEPLKPTAAVPAAADLPQDDGVRADDAANKPAAAMAAPGPCGGTNAVRPQPAPARRTTARLGMAADFFIPSPVSRVVGVSDVATRERQGAAARRTATFAAAPACPAPVKSSATGAAERCRVPGFPPSAGRARGGK